MVLKADQERVRTLLTETITLLCKNGLHYQSEFSIEGLIAITVDNHEIFLVSLKETFHVPTNTERLKVHHRQDGAAEVIHSNPSKASDDGRSSDSVEFSDISQAPGCSSTRCLKSRGRRSVSSLPDLPKHDNALYADQKDLDHISRTFTGGRQLCSSSANNSCNIISNTESSVKMKLESYGTLDDSREVDLSLAAFKDSNDQNLSSINSSLVIQEEDSSEINFGMGDVKKELSEEDNEADTRHCITIEPKSPSVASMNNLFVSKYSSQMLSNAYPTTDTGIYQPSALETSSMNINVTPERTDPWPSAGRRPARRGGGAGAGKRHTCQMCNKSFTFASALTHHENNIHGRRPHPFKCFICGKGFWNQRSMRGHMTSKHLMQTEFCCPICHKEYAYKVSLRDHMKLYHNMTL